MTVISEPSYGWGQPWPRVFELAEALDGCQWVLVGGLMVQTHAFVHNVETTRVTTDVDAATRIEAGSPNYTAAAASVLALGYEVDTNTERAYRFRRGDDVVDLMAPDHMHPPPRYAGRDVMLVEAGTQAMDRATPIEFQHGSATSSILVPNLHGALVLKAAAYLVDQRERDRHLLDAITLLACISDTSAIVANLAGSDRSRLTHLLNALRKNPLIYAQAAPDTAELARQAVAELEQALGL